MQLAMNFFELYNEIGQQLFAGKNIEKQDFSGLPKGIYFLEINNEKSFKIKFFKI